MARALRIAIVGGGAAGATAGGLLAAQGADVTVFDDGRRAPLLVGESLVPAVVPILRRLGIEDAVRAIATHKPGVTFAWSDEDVFRFVFARFADRFPPYAYNVPRPAFDALLLETARRLGVRVVEHRAALEHDGDRVALAAATRRAGGYDAVAPDLVVDATGRARAVARLLELPTRHGSRDDVAHFAHYEGFAWAEAPGQVLISRLRVGWSWRIPLGTRLSVGIVLARDAAAALGSTPEARLERAVADDPALAAAGRGARRVTPVMTYGNYQLLTERAHGPGWALVGDALGFVDPMLSPGVFLALQGAERLAAALAPAVARGGVDATTAARLDAYARAVHGELDAWMELVESIYSGHLFGLHRAGTLLTREHANVVTRLMERHIGRHIAGMASGVRTTSPYSRGLVRFLARHGMRGVDPRTMAVRSA